ncbi:DNA polymerase III subunit beta [Azovibrio restrictus]|uniref:DNA polymerase III subunit beta n=1 Tax=Azovibrio restrictus TaxID=146938 RepID=UPI0026EF2743|nr:DNA polymerase III subunit beta [Azovibrio restrictus]
MVILKSQRDALLAPLQSVSGIVERRHTLPILSNVLLEKQGETLTLIATDIEIQITTWSQNVGGNGDGTVTVGAKKLLDILRSLPESAEIILDMEDKRLLVKAGRSRFSLQTLPADDFPRMAIAEGENKSLTVTQKQFRHLIAKTQYAMATQDVRYYLNGLMLMVDGKELRSVATDGHRLAFNSMEIEADLPRQEMILPRKTVLELNRLLADNDDPMEITLGSNQIRFTFGHTVLVSKLIDGKFPDYERVIPTQLPNQMVANRQTLHAALSRAAILTNDKFRGVRVMLGENSLKLIAANAEQEEAQEEIEVAYTGASLDVGFNVTYLLDVLNNLSGDEVQWSFNDANSSALITVPGNDRFKYVVMPMRI